MEMKTDQKSGIHLGEAIHKDELTRRLYATDASIYEEMPTGVSFPKNIHDIQKLVLKSIDEGFTITARSAGTSLAGQTTGNGIIMDVSRHMTSIKEFDPKLRTVKLEPGVIRDTLNRTLAEHGLQFGPDTATTNRCMIGGMIGNNSCGSFSIKHGTTREHTLEIDTVLSDGSIVTFKALTANELDAKCNQGDLEGHIYREMIDLLNKHKDDIPKHYPHPDIKRRNTGYALDRLCDMDPITPGGRPFNLAELLCGSEGTLALTASAKLNIVPLPKVKNLVIPQFQSLHDAMLATVEAVKWAPAAVELVDDIILNATKGNIEQRKNRFFLEGDPACLLIIQFEGDTEEEITAKATGLTDRLKELGLGYAHPTLIDPVLMPRVWELRKAGLGLLMGLGAESRSPTFVEDTAVRVEDLPAYVKDFQEILKKHNTTCVFYAHASVGELHLRPMMDITKPEGLQTMKEMAHEVALLVKKYRGSLSGEHGDGRTRAPFIEIVLGKEMIPVLKRVKQIWDPENRFNPGKITDPKPIDSDLRFSPDYVSPDVETTFQWRNQGGFAGAIELCNGAGVCRKLAQSGGTMCPSYHATRDEKDSTRGRANVFRQLFSGEQKDAFQSEELKEALEYCLSCKACKSECPANVDMAKMKAEFTHGWHREKGFTLGEYFFGHPEKFYPVASIFSGLTNFVNRQKPVKMLLEKLLGVDSRRNLPEFASEPFMKWYQKNHQKYEKQGGRDVVLLVDLFTNYHDPEVAISALKVLHYLGYNVTVPGIFPTGRPQLSKGFLDHAKQICVENIKRLFPYAKNEIPIVGLEPSELLTLRDEYLDLCEDSDLESAKQISDNTFLWEEFLNIELATAEPMNTGDGRSVFVHGHCHTKALIGNDSLLQAFRQMGFKPVELKTGCCGMAGSFGYQSDKYELSMKIGDEVLFPSLGELPDDAIICSPGFSCRHQIADGVQMRSQHPAVIMANAIGSSTPSPSNRAT
tara:strand:+ start:45268 stop:48201 length:2934 start_codon:yes stop_codon:yes gene_type:complete